MRNRYTNSSPSSPGWKSVVSPAFVEVFEVVGTREWLWQTRYEQRASQVRGRASSAKRLPDLHEVKPMGPDDANCLEQLREVLIRNGAVDRFGITLLHDHFEVQPDELLVETCEPEFVCSRLPPSAPKSRLPRNE